MRTPDRTDRAAREQQLKDEGVMQSDGTINADAEFDAELNALQKELNAVESEGGSALDSITASK